MWICRFVVNTSAWNFDVYKSQRSVWNFPGIFKSRVKGIGSGGELNELLSGRGGSTDVVVNVAAGEFRFVAVVLNKNLVCDKTYEKIGVAGSRFSTHGYAISLFVVVATEWEVPVRLEGVVFQS